MVNPGETITLVCVASGGDPPPALSWVRPGGEELPRRSVLNRGTLTIPVVSVEDGGAYSCVASNNVGNAAKKSTNILVRGMTSHPSAQPDFNQTTGFSFYPVGTRPHKAGV